jgi:hypothetical protein
MKYLVLLSAIVLSSFILPIKAVQSQAIDFKNYKLLKSSGEIPVCVTKTLTLKNEIESKNIADDKKTSQQKKEFLMKSDWELFQLVRKGNVLFNDPIGLYITEVARELLKNDPRLFEELNFFAIRYPEVNAFSNNSGFIFVNIGLIANLETESELAFILAHEIAHYVKKHPMEAHLDNLKLFKDKKAYRYKSYNKKIDLIGKRSREIEFESDSIGISLFLESSYNLTAIDRSLNQLHYSYIPFSDEPFDIHFFNDREFVIPECYFLDSCSGKSPIKDTYDENYSHPNIYKRKAHVQSILADKQTLSDRKDFLVSENRFRNVIETARFELVHLNVRNEEYGDAIYNAYSLLKQYPDNKYLELSIAKSLYGLTKYKNEDKYYYVAEPYEKAEEQSQQVHYFLKQLNRKQLNVLSVKYIQKMKKKYPTADFLDKLETDLINEMIIKNDIDFEKFSDTVKNNSYEIVNNSSTKRELQKITENFYLLAFRKEARNDPDFIRKCTEAKKAKIMNDKKPLVSQEEKEKQEKKTMLEIREKGLPEQFSNIIILDPYLAIDREKIEKEYSQYDNYKKQLDQTVKESAIHTGIKHALISSRDIYTGNDIDQYNNLCIYREMMNENLSHDIESFYPVGAEYFCDENIKKDELLCYMGLFDNSVDEKYYITFIDLDSGNSLYWNEKETQKGRTDKVLKYLNEDFQILTKQKNH